eukprot:4630335-Ditylum_brightwellii.AAC.2
MDKLEPQFLCCFICSTSILVFVEPVLHQSDISLEECVEVASSAAPVEDFCIIFKNYNQCRLSQKVDAKMNIAKILSYAKVEEPF